MAEPSNTDLAVQIARLEGKVDGFLVAMGDQAADRRDIHAELDALTAWRNRMTGLGLAAGFILTAVDVAAAVWIAVHH